MSAIVDETAARINKELRSLSLEIHSNPELAWEEFKAHDLLSDYLDTQGFRVSRKFHGIRTAFLAEFGEEGDPIVSFLSEYDALPGIGHACGHNLIAIVGIGSAICFKEAMIKLGLKVHLKLFGTPAEERDGGKIALINKGAFKGVKVALMAHPGNLNCVYAKYLALKMLSVEYFGKAAHAAAAPWDGINALDAMVISYQNISALRQQMQASNRVHGIIKKGGEAPNIVPDYTQAEYFVRASTRDELLKFLPRVEGCFNGAATATGCTVKLTQSSMFCDVKYNEELSLIYVKHMEKLGAVFPSRQIQESAPRGSTDMGNVSYETASIHPVFDIGINADIHTTSFREAASTEEAHLNAMRVIKALALTGIDCVYDNKLYDRVRKEFDESS